MQSKLHEQVDVVSVAAANALPHVSQLDVGMKQQTGLVSKQKLWAQNAVQLSQAGTGSLSSISSMAARALVQHQVCSHGYSDLDQQQTAELARLAHRSTCLTARE